MNCSDYEMNIYLFAELSEGEQHELHQHLATCASCRGLFQAVEKTQGLVRTVALQEPAPRHAAQLTRKILDGIAAEKPRSVSDILYGWLNTRAVRYALVATSALFVVGFGSEMLPTVFKAQGITRTGAVVLNSRELRKTFVKRKANKPAYASCMSPLRSVANWKDCIKSNLN